MPTRYEAHHENRIYYFYITSKEPQELRILMYKTPYTLIIKKDQWENAQGNQMSMSQGLVNAVVEAAAAT